MPVTLLNHKIKGYGYFHGQLVLQSFSNLSHADIMCLKILIFRCAGPETEDYHYFTKQMNLKNSPDCP